jgi:hypothetical protein
MARLRIRNLTGDDLDSVRVHPPGPDAAPVEFGPLAVAATSTSREVPGVYRFAHIEVSGPSGSYTLLPYDYVGEVELPAGEHTYVLGLAGGRLTLDVVREGA